MPGIDQLREPFTYLDIKQMCQSEPSSHLFAKFSDRAAFLIGIARFSLKASAHSYIDLAGVLGVTDLEIGTGTFPFVFWERTGP